MTAPDDRPHEKCAVVGVSLTATTEASASRIAALALFALQHRGVEGSGIVTTEKSVLTSIRRPGMVRDVFGEAELSKLPGRTAIGHNRYSTNGDKFKHLQPVVSESIGFALAHNGNFPDTEQLEEYLEKRRYIHSQYNDSEIFGNTLASKLHGGRSFEDSLLEVSHIAPGAYACTALYDDTLYGFRDPHGIRPLELGELEGGLVLASETCALDTIGATHIRSIQPGELIAIRDGKIVYSTQFAQPTEHTDVFELVYFARHDSVIRGQRIDTVRRHFGEKLAELHPPTAKDLKNILVTAVPDTSIPAAEAYAATLGLRHQSAIIKNRYIGRTFMQPSQESRQSSLRLKHTMIPELIKGKDLIMIDDSIVRGNTLPRLVELARQLGAASITVLIASPPIRFPDFYGVDTPDQTDLMAATQTPAEMQAAIGADYLGFLSVPALIDAINLPRESLNLAAFTGEYPIDIGKHARDIKKPVSEEYIY